MTEPRHAFFETDEKVELNVFIKDANPEGVKVEFAPRKLNFAYDDKSLVLDPLRGEIDPEKSSFRVGKVKIEILLVKRSGIRWGGLSGETDIATISTAPAPSASEPPPAAAAKKARKNWDAISTQALEAQGKDKTTSDDPNAGGDAAVNSFFQQIYAGADEDTKRAMMKSYSESGGTALSTDWSDVKKKKVPVQPPAGQEYKKLGA